MLDPNPEEVDHIFRFPKIKKILNFLRFHLDQIIAIFASYLVTKLALSSVVAYIDNTQTHIPLLKYEWTLYLPLIFIQVWIIEVISIMCTKIIVITYDYIDISKFSELKFIIWEYFWTLLTSITIGLFVSYAFHIPFSITAYLSIIYGTVSQVQDYLYYSLPTLDIVLVEYDDDYKDPEKESIS